MRKDFREAPADEIAEQVRTTFDLSLAGLPADMRADIFAYLIDHFPDRQGEFPELLDYTTYMGDVIDLLNEEYDEDNDPLYAEDWEFVRDSVSDFAGDLDMKLLNYVMGLVVAKGYID
jgi:hypothetical protein